MSIKDTTSALDRVAIPLSRFMDIIGRGILVLMVLLITMDVILRYFFNRPIKGSYELLEFMMVVLVFLGLAYTQTQKGHISITLLTGKLSEARQAVIRNATDVLTFFTFVVVTWRCIVEAETLRLQGTTSDILLLPNYPFMWLVVFGSVMLSFVFLIDVLKSLDDVLKNCKIPALWISLNGIFVLFIFYIPVWLHWLPWDISRPAMGLVGMGLLLVLLFSNMSIGPVLALVGLVGFSYLVNTDAALALLGKTTYRSSASQAMSTIPLFVLMGGICFHAELSKEIYTTMRNWLGKLPGGLAMATIGGCAGFAAVSGSSMATAITMGTIALPEMRRYKYADSLACGCVAAGGSIGILIPPSIVFIIYATLTEESIGALFMAGVIPGILETFLYILTIYIICKLRPEAGPSGPSSTWKEKFYSLKDTWGILALFALVIGGIYGGIFTPTEAAGIGAFGALLLGYIKRTLNLTKLMAALSDACRNTAMIFLMIIGADIFSYFLTMSQIPFILSDYVVALPVSPGVTILAILVVYIILGCFLPIMAAIILTIPIFLPVVTGLGYSPIWFGVLVVTMAELGQITPPVGINVFALAGVAKDTPLSDIFKGIFPFVIADIIRVLLIFFFPALALYLPSIMG